jgi:signal peptide peptidase SppA
MKYSRIVAEFHSRAWAIREETLLAMQELIYLQAVEGLKWTPQEIRERIEAANSANGYLAPEHILGAYFVVGENCMSMQAANGKRSAASPGSVAVIPISGIISQRMSMMSQISGAGGTSIERLTAQFRQALGDTNCKAIVFDVDSPGGSVEGVPELASEIVNARKQKPISAVVNSMACSAAYWLASAASEMVCTPSGQAGSIGVYMMHQDESKALENEGVKITVIKAGKYKTEGNPAEPLSDEARAAFQSKVDTLYGMFVKSVAQNRGTSQAAVRDGYGQGRSLLANDAVKENLVDRVATMDDVLQKYGVKPGSSIAAAVPDSQVAAASGTAVPRADNLPEDEDDVPCGCGFSNGKACKACKSCENQDAKPPKADGEMGCACACNACKGCDGKAEDMAKAKAATMNLERRRRQVHLL